MDLRRRLVDLVALLTVIATTTHLGARLDSSVAFARPIHFAVLVLFIVGLFFGVPARGTGRARPPAVGISSGYSNSSVVSSPLVAVDTAPPSQRRARACQRLALVRALKAGATHAVRVARRVKVTRSLFAVLLASIVSRTFVAWRSTEYVQCSSSWAQAASPFFICVADLVLPPQCPGTLPHVQPAKDHDAGRVESRIGAAQPLVGPGLRNIGNHTVLALIWAVAGARTLLSWHSPAGIICPRSGWSEHLIPAMQVFGLALDAVVAVQLARVRNKGDNGVDGCTSASSGECYRFLSSLFLWAALVVWAFGLLVLLRSPTSSWLFRFRAPDIRELGMDSLAASALVVSSIHLLISLHPATLAAVIIGLASYARHVDRLSGEAGVELRHWASPPSLEPALMLGVTGLLIKADRDLSQTRLPSSSALAHRALLSCYLALVCGATYWHVGYSLSTQPTLSGLPSLESIIGTAQAESERWQARAATSKTLESAVSNYRARHGGIPPPPNFDRWYEFAMARNSPVLDEFSQVSTDLLPFWGVAAVAIRERTTYLLETPRLSIGGLRIRKGDIELSPNIPGTHRWMMESMAAMIRPFAQWLPDMDLAFNLDDECRVALPYENRLSLLHEARETQSRLARMAQHGRLISKFESSSSAGQQADRRWSERFHYKHDEVEQQTGLGLILEKLRLVTAPSPSPSPRPSNSAGLPRFVNFHATPIFRDLVAPACAPDAPARTKVWWSRNERCAACAAGHMTLTTEGPVLSNWTSAGDVCNQPDLAQLNGFLMAPSAMVATTTLLPIFSQAKITGFADVLIPSPWNFDAKSSYDPQADPEWADKRNDVFWRGSASDGYATDNAWTSFARARFVDQADERAAACDALETAAADEDVAGPSSSTSCLVGANVSFVGDFHRCDQEDCKAERQTFFQYSRRQQIAPTTDARDQTQRPAPASSTAGSTSPPQSDEATAVPFSEHWQHKHLVDLDGAGFSGRFLPFLRSRSLVYRAALFRTWFDERVHPWRHFIPLDIRLGAGLWSVVDFFGGGTRGSRLAEQIATDGCEWASRALRTEDMEVYMFRLLLEWGRLVDDRREEMGFDSSGVS